MKNAVNNENNTILDKVYLLYDNDIANSTYSKLNDRFNHLSINYLHYYSKNIFEIKRFYLNNIRKYNSRY
jgi:hypothetical protein